MQRWDKHKDLDDDHWTPIVEFVQMAFPNVSPMPDVPISYQEWFTVLRKKRKRTATGPDGMSRLDLLHLPRDLVEQLLLWLWKIEQGESQWPQQWTTGIVHCLEKTSESCKVEHFRPITVFALVYRTWSSLRARQALKFLAEKVPGTCFGSVPSRSATNMWMGIQCLLETRTADGQGCSGAVLDIQKCFNHLPRIPTIQILTKLGMASGVLRAWSKALTVLSRRFSIRNSTGPSLQFT